MNNGLINQLSKLNLEYSALKRNLDRNYYNRKTRDIIYKRMKEVNNEIQKIKFKIRLEREKRK